METSSWLPPLNSHNQFDVYVKASQPSKAVYDPSLLHRIFSITIKICVNFYSDNVDINERSVMFEGLSTEYEFSIICGKIANNSVNILTSMLDRCFIPLDLDGAVWVERQLDDGVLRDCQLRDNSYLVRKILEFLCRMDSKKYNSDKKVLPFKLEIEKMVTIPDEELRAWNSWYDEKKRTQVNFERSFREAIRRPRTYDEWISETQMNAFKGSAWSSIQELVEVVKLNDSISKSGDCSVCLEEFKVESQPVRLPCCHVFHKDCIVKWLQDSHMCPLCRYIFPTNCSYQEKD